MRDRREGRHRLAIIHTGVTDRLLGCVFVSLAITLAIVACGASSDGCECDGELDDDGVCLVTDETLTDAQITEGALWESVPWRGAPWLCFASGIKLQISHSLGYTPALVQVYLSFANSDDGPYSFFLASGDLARIIEVTDTHVVIENGTEEFFFLRMALE